MSAPRCPYDPTPLKGAPMGMFHCPECGCMIIAGWEHTICTLSRECPYFDEEEEKLLAKELDAYMDRHKDNRKGAPDDW